LVGRNYLEHENLTMSWLVAHTLSGSRVSLEPLSHDHHDDLVESVLDGELWKLWYTSIPTPDEMHAEIDRRLNLQKKEAMLPFVVIDSATGKIIGMTTYMNVDSINRRIEIGSTWYRK
jgi:RimJ/RimL family protein N-acetyltransferase